MAETIARGGRNRVDERRTLTAEFADARPGALSVLFVTYRRPELLERSFASLRPYLSGLRVEYVVSDDGSPADVQSRIRTMPFDRYVFAKRNQGLGANNNKGLAACTGRYILLLQDDWQAMADLDGIIGAAIEILENDPDVGMIRFYGDPNQHPPLERRTLGRVEYFVCDHRHKDYNKRYHVYSDTPHLRRAILSDPAVLGAYKEGCSMEESEEEYSNRFEQQGRFRIAFMSPHERRYFLHLGAETSYRTRKLRYRAEAAVRTVALSVGLHPDMAFWRALRPGWFALKNFLIRLRVLK